MLDALIDKLGSGLVQLLGLVALGVVVVLTVWLRSKVMDVLGKHFVVSEIQNDQQITELLVEIRVGCEADRVSIYMFHNGERYTNGNSMLRLSGAYETLAAGISSQRPNSQNVLVSTVPEAVEFLVDDDVRDALYSGKTADLEPCFYRAALEAQGVRCVAKYPLCKGPDIIGFVCADFVQTDTPHQLSLDIIKQHAPKLEMYLNDTKKTSLWRRLFGGK